MSEATAAKQEMKFSLKPMFGKIVVQEDAFRYEGRIVIPEKAQRRPTTGEVVSLGEGITGIEIGDKLVYGLYSGVVVNFKGHPVYRVLNQDEILAVVVGMAPELEGVGAA